MKSKYSISKLNNNKGFVLILTYLLIVTLSILGMAFFARTLSERKVTNVDKESILAFNMAKAGVARTIVYMREAQPTNTTAFDPFNGDQTLCSNTTLTTPACSSPNIVSGTYRVTVTPNGVFGSSRRFIISVKGTSGQVSRTVNATIQTDNFARFAYFSDTEHYGQGWWRTPVWFISGDQIWGPTHTNGHYHVSGSPTFYDSTASTDNFLTYYHGGLPDDNPQFIGGLTMGADPIPMPSQAIALHNAGVQGGIVYNGNTTIVLNSNGTMTVTNSQANCNPCTGVAKPANNALYVAGGDLTISGILNGSLTVGSNRNIIIPDNLTYNTLPAGSSFCPTGATVANDGSGRACSSSADKMGVIAEKQVIISASAPYNMEIDASVMAMDKSFLVENWDSGSAKGNLKVFGGIIQNQRGPVGTFNSNTNSISTGYGKSYIYDSRFTTSPPDFFPQTGDYLKLLWLEAI